ncbi:MAG: histidine phosphatase family protein [Caldilineaceae bacterium]
MQLYLITHAHTQAQPSEDATVWQLSPKGREQASLLAQQPFWEQVEQIVLSTEAKTRLTIGPVLAQRALPVYEDQRLNELRRVGWVTNEEYGERVRKLFAEPTHSIHGWESAQDALQRVLAAINYLCAYFTGKTVALVGHGLTLSLYRAYLLGNAHVDFTDWQQLSFAAVALVDPEKRQLLQDFLPVAGYARRG